MPPTRWLREHFGEDGYYVLWHKTPVQREGMPAGVTRNYRGRELVSPL